MDQSDNSNREKRTNCHGLIQMIYSVLRIFLSSSVEDIFRKTIRQGHQGNQRELPILASRWK